VSAWGLQQKLLAAFLVTALAVLLVLAGLWYAGSRSQLDLAEETAQAMREQALAGLEERGKLISEFLLKSLPNQLYYYDLQGLRQTARSALEEDDVEYVVIFDDEGRIVHDGSQALERFGEVMNDELAQAIVDSDELLVQWTDRLVDISRPIQLGQETIGGVRVGLTRASSDALIAAQQREASQRVGDAFLFQLRMLLLGFLALLLVAAALTWLIGRGLIRPIRSLAAAVEDLEAGRFESAQLEKPRYQHRGDELGALIRSFSQMARSIQNHDQAIRKLAFQDTLTGLPNRLMFRELLDETIAECHDEKADAPRPLGLMFIDIDNFKRINDTLGHDAGDDALIEVARRLRSSAESTTRDGGTDRTLIARLGGDEFVVLVSGGDVLQRCQRLAERILVALSRPFQMGEQRLKLSASIGITRYPDDAQTSKLMLKCGDLAMYQAKLSGKNGFAFYNEHLTHAADRTLLLEQDLRQAIEDHQIRVAYQPIIDPGSGRLVSAEALLRWHHPRLGDVPPEQFVAVAEASNLIENLGAQVVDIACRDAARWQNHLPGVRVAVNVSGQQLLKPGLDDRIFKAVQASGLDSRLLGIELTESSLLQDQFLASKMIETLRNRGVRIWLDDFGTGFSGLSHLRQVHVDGVKIDRSFVADLTDAGDDLALTSAIIAMAHSIGMKVIAEGVENDEQLALLKTHGCDYVQGFLFGRAMSAEALIEAFQEPRP
jgi:diguanylate cyclase (GGDEF)-like protein